MKQERPFFMTNDEWYYFDEKEFCLKLTEKAPPKAKKSYDEFYKDSFDPCGLKNTNRPE